MDLVDMPLPARSHLSGRARLCTVALIALPFMVGATGVGQYIGWFVALAIVFGDWEQIEDQWTLLAIVGVIATAIGPPWYRGTPFHIGAVVMAGAGGLLVTAWRMVPRKRILFAAVAISLGGLGWSVTHDPGSVLDVTLMHHAGADALASGRSPWTGLEVPSGAPGAEGTVISGDPYPPVSLLSYSVGDWLTGDPRSAGAVAWILIAVSAFFLKAKDPRPLILLITSGGLPLLLWTGWTEILTVALTLLALSVWRLPKLASSLLGVALASKQYMVTLVPLLIGAQWDRRRLRGWLTVAVAAALAAAGFALGPGYLHAIVGVYGEFDARTDASSLYGFLTLFTTEFNWPSWLGPIAAIGTSGWLAVKRPFRRYHGFVLDSAITLSVLLLLGTQAFSNYWFLIWAYVLVSVASEPRVSTDGQLPT